LSFDGDDSARWRFAIPTTMDTAFAYNLPLTSANFGTSPIASNIQSKFRGAFVNLVRLCLDAELPEYGAFFQNGFLIYLFSGKIRGAYQVGVPRD
jgi:hypothetical protein